MILKGSQRGGALQLARHLLKTDENDHVEVHELRGFASESLTHALHEVVAMAKGTACSQFLFSLSLNPPETETVPVKVFEDAVERVEQKLGLSGQPRAIVFHEKEGRRHAHAVWSRIDTEQMKAINLPFYKDKLTKISKELFLEQGWRLPDGLRDKEQRDPTTFSREEWQQAKRTKQDPRALKALLQECWAVSDTRAAFAHALEERGFYLAKGDRRGFVAVDFRGEVYVLSRWTGRKTRDLKDKLGDPSSLPSVNHTKEMIAGRMTGMIRGYITDVERILKGKMATTALKKAQMRERHRADRQELKDHQAQRWAAETQERSGRFRRGARGLWDWITGKSKDIRRQNEREAEEAMTRDGREREALIKAQLAERRGLQTEIRETKRVHAEEVARLNADVADYLRMSGREPERDQDHADDHQHHHDQFHRNDGDVRQTGPSPGDRRDHDLSR